MSLTILKSACMVAIITSSFNTLFSQTQTVGGGLGIATKTVLQNKGCDTWPPTLVKPGKQQTNPSAKPLSPKDQAKQAAYQQNFTSYLESQLGVDDTQTVQEFNTSFLRVFDAPFSTSDLSGLSAVSLSSDSNLLGLAKVLPASALTTWGTSGSAIRYNCNSLLQADIQANSGLTFPVATLTAAGKLQADMARDQTATFMVGTIQSPFDLMYNDKASDGSKRLLASLEAALWLAANPTKNHYIKAATLLSVELVQGSNDTSAMLANVSFGTKFPFLNSSSSFNDQIARALQTNADRFLTYIYADKNHLAVEAYPSLTDVLSTAQTNLPHPSIPNVPIIAGVSQTATTKIAGWPPNLCTTDWKATAANRYYPSPSVSFTSLDPTTAGMPVCQIDITYTLKVPKGDTSLDADQTLMADPQLSIQLKKFQQVTLSVSLDKPLQPAGKPTFHPAPIAPKWTHLAITPNGNEALVWPMLASVEPPTGVALTGYKIDPSGFTCQPDGSPAPTAIPIQASLTQGTLSADTLVTSPTSTLAATSQAVQVVFFVTPSSVSPAYNPDPNQINPKQCRISGSIVVQSTVAGTPQETKVSINSGPVNFPGQLSGMSLTNIVCASKTSASGGYILASVASLGLNCSFSGSGLSVIQQLTLRDKSDLTKPLIGNIAVTASNDNTFSVTFPPELLSSLNSTAYTFMIFDNTALHNLLPLNGALLNVVPLPVVTQQPSAITASATQSPFTVPIQGTGLDQVVEIVLRRTGAADVTSTSAAVTSTTVLATFPGTSLAAGSYEIFLVTDKTTPVAIDSRKALVLN